MGPTSSRLRVAAVAFLLWLAAIPGFAQQVAPEAQAPSPTAVRGRADRTTSEQKLDSMLMYAVRAFAPTRGQIPPAIQPLVQLFIDANVATDQTLFVVIKADVSPDLVAQLRVAGAHDISEFPQYGTITARVPITALPSIAQRTDVRTISPQQRYRANRTDDPESNKLGTPPSPIVKAANTGAVVWEGVTAHQADKAIATGFDGTGVKVCVLADGVTSLASRQTPPNPELPAVVDVLSGQAGNGDTGTAMLEIVHDMAPGATLGFATAIPSTVQFAANINSLQAAGCNIIVDGFYYSDEAAFQDDLVARAINTVTAAGVLYVSAAGDLGNLTHGTSGTYEGDFLASGDPVPAAITAGEAGATVILHSFGANPYTTLTAPTQFVTLQWSDPLGASANDYDLFVLNPSGTVLGFSTSLQSGTQDPFELALCSVCPFPIGSRIYIVQFDGATRALRLDASGGRISNGTGGSTFGHGAAASTLTVGTIDVRPVGGSAFLGGTSVHVDAASSDGPRQMFFNPNGTEITPGNLLFGPPVGGTTVPKVDLTAADCGSTSFPPNSPFCRTAAAASSAAALAALVKSAKPTATRTEITTTLLNSALDIESAGTDVVSGVGIPMAPAAVRSLLSPLTVAKSFVPNSIAAAAPAALTIAVTNPPANTVALKGVAFIDTYPTNVINGASPSPVASGPAGCAGTFAAVPGGGTFGVTATIPAGATCTFTVAVTSFAGGNYNDSTGAPTTPIGLNTPPATVPAATLTVSPALIPTLVSAVSHKVHGAAGTFDLPLSPFPTSPTVEPRSCPTNLGHQLVFTFDRVISAATATLTEGTATMSPQPISGTDNNVIVDLTGVANQQYVTVSLTDVASTDGTSGGSGSVRVGFLLGDVNGSQVVAVSDVGLVNQQVAQLVSPTNFLRDVNCTGTLTVADKGIANANVTKALPAP